MKSMSAAKIKADVVVVGGGASGMMAAASAAESGLKVVLVEKNSKLGRKLRITGKGRCNLTNDCDVKTIIENVPKNGRFLYSALNGLSPTDTIELFEGCGLPLKTERGRRVFPVSDSAQDVVNVLEGMLKSTGVIVKKADVKGILTKNNICLGVSASDGDIYAKSVILCTGGLSYPKTGSTGGGHRMLKELGHNITECCPSLVPLESSDDFCAEMQGFSLRNIALSVVDDRNETVFCEQGEMLFTHFGVSGPLVLSASAHMRGFGKRRYKLSIDLKPALDEKKLDMRILRDFQKYSNREFKNALGDLAGRVMIPVLIERSGIPGETKVNAVSKVQRLGLVKLFKAFEVDIIGTRPIDEAIVTSGGLSVKEVNPKTMESKLVSGLYIAGELLDVDGYTGGFNLQIAWSTGRQAGKSAADGARLACEIPDAD